MVQKYQILGPVSILRPSYLRMAISMLKIRRPLGRLIFNMGIAIPGKTVFLIETAPRTFFFGQSDYQINFMDTLLTQITHVLQ